LPIGIRWIILEIDTIGKLTMTRVRVGILGATGYTALESIRLLLNHPHVDITVATSRQEDGKELAEVHPMLAGRLDVTVRSLEPEAVAAQCDVAFCCLPHGASAETVRGLRGAGVRVIDFSADFRLSSVELYQQWYGVDHPWPEMIGKVPYGLPELFRDQLRDADLIANPGCYPTSAILPLAPLIRRGMIDPNDIIVDSKSGVSGAGRGAKLGSLYCEVNESIAAYGVGGHRHQPEIADIIHRFANAASEPLFTPHLTPMDRGILSTIYVRPADCTVDDVMRVWREQYDREEMVHVVEHLPATKHVSGSNHIQMTARKSEGGRSNSRLVLICAIDNLIKGAAGAAVQNLNCMFGFDEGTALT
jgi:N-acetyl-gamma-glutamyl-phosphate reductase